MMDRNYKYSESLWFDIIDLTDQFVDEGFNILTKEDAIPPSAAALSMAANHRF